MTRLATAFGDGFATALGGWAAVFAVAGLIFLILKGFTKGRRP